MNKAVTLFLFLVLCSMTPYFGYAVIVQDKGQTLKSTEANLNAEDIINLSRKELEEKIGRKLKFTERISIKILKRKLKKQANKSSDSNKTDPMAIVGFSFGLAGILFVLLIPIAPVLFFLALLFGIAGIIISAIALKRIKRDPESRKGRGLALTGLIVGIVAITATFIIAGIALAGFGS